MAVINALRTAGRTVVRNPIIVVITAIFSAVQLPVLLARAFDPLLAGVISLGFNALLIFLLPFVQGGLVGMVDEAIGGRADFGTFVSEGKANYVSVFVAYLLILAVMFVFLFVGIIGVSLGFGAVLLGSSEPNMSAFVVLGLVFLVLFAVLFLFTFFLQFYVQAIVIENVGAVAGIKHSYRCVRAHLASTLGYVLIAFVLGGTIGLFGAAISILTTDTAGVPFADFGTSAAVLLPVSVVLILVSGLLGGFMLTYSVAFYREIRVPVPT